jgi:hypothetical protein
MSFKAPRPPRARKQSSLLSRRPSTSFSQDATPRDHHLVPPSDAPQTRRGYGTKGRVRYRENEVLAEPLGRVFVQQPGHPRTSTSTATPPPEPALDDPFVDTGDAEPSPIYVSVDREDPELRQQRQGRKKERQWAKWANETIPSLLQPYLRILRTSDNLRNLNRHPDVSLPACSCERRASINVTCVFFERKLFYLQYV